MHARFPLDVLRCPVHATSPTSEPEENSPLLLAYYYAHVAPTHDLNTFSSSRRSGVRSLLKNLCRQTLGAFG